MGRGRGQQQRQQRLERRSRDTDHRLDHEGRARGVFLRDPTRWFDVDDLAAAARIDLQPARDIVTSLERVGWLERGSNDTGHHAWRRTADGQPADSRPLLGAPAYAPARHFCRVCRRGAHGDRPPDGWLRAQEHDSEAERRNSHLWQTRGLFCSPPCLLAWAAAQAATAPAQAG